MTLFAERQKWAAASEREPADRSHAMSDAPSAEGVIR
jgi:hypothetical protein